MKRTWQARSIDIMKRRRTERVKRFKTRVFSILFIFFRLSLLQKKNEACFHCGIKLMKKKKSERVVINPDTMNEKRRSVLEAYSLQNQIPLDVLTGKLFCKKDSLKISTGAILRDPPSSSSSSSSQLTFNNITKAPQLLFQMCDLWKESSKSIDQAPLLCEDGASCAPQNPCSFA